MHSLNQISQSTVARILKWTIKWKPFKFLNVQGLEQSHIDQRKEFCEWLLQQPHEFPQKVLWTDEVIQPFSHCTKSTDKDSFITEMVGTSSKAQQTERSFLGPSQPAQVQGDTSGCAKPPVDFKTKVLLWPARSGQPKLLF